MKPYPDYFDGVIYTGQPDPGVGRWTLLHHGKRCHIDYHRIEPGVLARYAGAGRYECRPCVQRREAARARASAAGRPGVRDLSVRDHLARALDDVRDGLVPSDEEEGAA